MVLNNISSGIENKIDRILLNFTYILGLFMSMFTSLFIGTEFAYGTIRNKIIVGHSRKNIYLSNLIFSIVSGIIFQIVYMLIVILFGTFTIGGITMSLSSLLLVFLEMLIIIIAYASIFNFVTLLCSDMTVATTVCMLLFLTMYVFAATLSSTVNTPEYIEHTMFDEYGNIQIIEKEPNPNYPSELKMTISKIIYYSIPIGSAMQIAGDINNIDIVALFSHLTLVIILFNGIGMYLFNKKDLK